MDGCEPACTRRGSLPATWTREYARCPAGDLGGRGAAGARPLGSRGPDPSSTRTSCVALGSFHTYETGQGGPDDVRCSEE